MPDYMKYQYSEELEFIDCSMLDPKDITTEFQTRALRLGTQVLSIQKQIKDVEQVYLSFICYYVKLSRFYYLEEQ